MTGANNLRNRNGIKANGFKRRNSNEKLNNGGRTVGQFEAEELNALKMKEKLLFLEDGNNNVNNGYSAMGDRVRGQANEEESADLFADTFTVKPNHLLTDHHEETIEVFNKSAKDQFAASLLRLQADLDSANKRLAELEGKMDSLVVSKQESQQQQQQQSRQAKSSSKSTGPGFSPNNSKLINLVYFGWPIVVFLAIRALEKRNSLKAQ